MRRSAVVAITIAIAACSAGENSGQQSSTASGTVERADAPNVASARKACESRERREMEVGISDYETCLGERANLSRPADRQLCDLARSTMSADGVCILSE